MARTFCDQVICFKFITSHKMLAVLLPKGGSWSQAFHAWTAETWDENAGNQLVSYTRQMDLVRIGLLYAPNPFGTYKHCLATTVL